MAPERRVDLLREGFEDGWGGRELRIFDRRESQTILTRPQMERFGFTGADHGLLDWSASDVLLLGAWDTPEEAVFSVVETKSRAIRDLRPGRAPRGYATRFSPDGRWIAYHRDGSMYVIPVDGGSPQRLFPDESTNRFLAWTPNGRGVLFMSDRSGTWDLGLVHVQEGRRVDLPVWLARDVGPVHGERVTSDGSVFYSVSAGTIYGTTSLNLGDVFLVSTDPDTGRVTSSPAKVSQRPGHTARPVWSRDGRLAFKSGPGGTVLPGISILAVEKGVEQVLKTTLTSPRYDWSPDGRFFLQVRPLQLTDAVTGESRQIGERLGGELPKFFPDGASVVFRSGQTELRRVTLQSLEVETLMKLEDGLQIGGYSISTDGRAIAVIVHDARANKRGIRVLTIADRSLRQIVALDASMSPDDRVAWSHDNRYVVFSDATAATMVPGTQTRQSELWRVAPTGGTPERLGLTYDDIRQIAVAPDGRHLAFQFERELRAGLWVMERLLPASELRPSR